MDYAPLTNTYVNNQEPSNPYNVPEDYYMNIALREDNTRPTKVSLEYFSVSNIKRLQQMIKTYVYENTKHKFKLEEDQNVLDLIQAMKYIYKEYGKYMPNSVIRQVKKLNTYTIKFIVPNIIENLKQYYGYLKDINNPIQPIEMPTNVNRAGRLQLPGSAHVYNL